MIHPIMVRHTTIGCAVAASAQCPILRKMPL
jgi:hypothetical protein